VAESPISSAGSIAKTVGTRISSTITPSERRAFETILRFEPDKRAAANASAGSAPSGVKQQSPFVDAVDTDIENILDIFSTSVKDYQRDARPARPARPTRESDDDDDDAAFLDSHLVERPAPTSEPEVDQTTTIRAADESLSADERPHLTDEEAAPRSAQPSVTTTPSEVVSDKKMEAPAAPSLAEQSFSEITPSLQLDRFDEPIQRAIRDRMTDISRKLLAAVASKKKRGDVAMWEVCETEIFSLASSLQAPESTNSKVALPRRAQTNSQTSTQPKEATTEAECDGTTKANQVPPPVVHHVYPAALLLALRLYIHHFPASPLAHNLLPRVRSFGRTSYVLGASPQFYNSLMSLVWLARSSLREIDGLLSEMERGGVEVTEETYRILQKIEDERADDLERLSGQAGLVAGSRGGAWWKRHEQVFWFPRILDWLAVVSKRLNMRQMEESRV
jgi:hypothetical protein